MTVAAIAAAAANVQICRRFIKFLGLLGAIFRLIEAHRSDIPPNIPVCKACEALILRQEQIAQLGRQFARTRLRPGLLEDDLPFFVENLWLHGRLSRLS